MRQELDRLLCERYPEIFKNRYADMQVTAMCWGFECGDGWFEVLNSLCAQIQNHLDWVNRDTQTVSQVVADQVKEKFGGLRFYYTGGDEYISGMVRMAESWAANTCEQCGNPGTARGGGWIRTLCDQHAKERA